MCGSNLEILTLELLTYYYLHMDAYSSVSTTHVLLFMRITGLVRVNKSSFFFVTRDLSFELEHFWRIDGQHSWRKQQQIEHFKNISKVLIARNNLISSTEEFPTTAIFFRERKKPFKNSK